MLTSKRAPEQLFVQFASMKGLMGHYKMGSLNLGLWKSFDKPLKRRIEELPLLKKKLVSLFSASSTEVEIYTAKPTGFLCLERLEQEKIFASKKHQDNLDKQYLNICDCFLDLRVVNKRLIFRKQPNNLPNSSTRIQNNKFMTIG